MALRADIATEIGATLDAAAAGPRPQGWWMIVTKLGGPAYRIQIGNDQGLSFTFANRSGSPEAEGGADLTELSRLYLSDVALDLDQRAGR